MKLALIFICTFLGVILSIAGALGFFKALITLINYLKRRTGRSDTEVVVFVYVVFMALVIAGGVTIAAGAGKAN
jgi:hypothetical protein